MQATTEQQAAIRTQDKNLIVVAGAGSGKTRVLVARYLQLLESNPAWPISALVAITFTREAAFEMRHRVRLEMEQRASGPDAALWEQRLLQLENARIDTIHGLCADIIRANAAQAGVDPKFEVLDEIEAAIMLDDVVEDVLADIKPPVSELFAHYDAWKIEAALKQMSLVSADYPPPAGPEDLFARWMESFNAKTMAERGRLIDSDEAAALVKLANLPAEDKLAELVLQYKDYLSQLAHDEIEAEGVMQLMRRCHAEGAVGSKGTAAKWGGKHVKDEVANLLRELRKRVTSALDAIGEMPGELDRQTAQLLPLWHALLQETRNAYRERKQAAAQLDFDDLERMAADLLEDTAVRVRYRNAEFKHLLVDEFQDTNEAQWRIINQLADVETAGSLFVVGDPKQSIYQFRGADVSVFNSVRANFHAYDACLELPLSMSFRSHHALVEQFNALFELLLVRDEDSPVADYQVVFDKPMSAFRQDSPESPAIELQLLDSQKRDESGEPVRGKRNRLQRYAAEEMRHWEAYELAARIQAIVAERRQVFDKAERSWRDIEYGDIAMLFQSMSNVTTYEDALKTAGLPFVTVAGRGYYDRQEVWDMLELLRFLHNPADDLALATVLRSPIFAFSDDLLFALRLIPAGENGSSGPLPLWEALAIAANSPTPGMLDTDLPLAQHALATLWALQRISGRVTISELLHHALNRTNYLAILTGLPDGARRRGNIEKLLHLAEASAKSTLGKFSRYLTDLTAREVRESEALMEAGNAVRLMTVHASKGLEFPLVILADASWERGSQAAPTLLVNPKGGFTCQVYDPDENRYVSGYAHQCNAVLSAQKEAAERKRLLYVAATRAQDYLVISGQVGQSRDGLWTSKGWLRQLIGALDLEDLIREPEQRKSLAERPVSVIMPTAPPPAEVLYHSAHTGDDLWCFEANESEYPPQAPPLLERLKNGGAPQLRHVTATQIADLGEYRRGLNGQQRQSAARRFRQSAARGLSADGRPLPIGQQTVTPAIIGEIVHDLLRYGRFTLDEPNSRELLSAVCWEKGITNAADARRAGHEAETLLALHRASDVYRWVSSAHADGRPLYTELSFIFRTGKRVVHGAMDLALQLTDGAWAVIDYKTSAVIGGAYEQHAERYLLQLGVYAAALRAKLSLDHWPQTYVHYLRGNRTVRLAENDCLAELDQLETTIGDLVTNDD